MKPLVSSLVLFAVVGLAAAGAGCGKKNTETTAAKNDVVDRMLKGRAAALGFRPPGVARLLVAAQGDTVSRADSVTALGVWIELRRQAEGGLMGVWIGDTTMVQIAGGTGLRGFARPGEAGADLLRLATAEPLLFENAGTDLEPPPDGAVRIWVATPAGLRRYEQRIREFVDETRRTSPFLQEARLFTRTSLGGIVDYEKSTAATLESLGVTPEHTAAKLALAAGIDPEAEH